MIRNYIYLVSKRMFRNKKYLFLNILMLIIMLATLMTTLSLSIFINNFTQLNYNNNFTFRKLLVSYDNEIYSEQEAINNLSTYPNIDLVIPQDEYKITVEGSTCINSSSFIMSLVSCTQNTVPHILNNSTIDDNSIIIPDKFLIESDGEVIDGRQLIGKTIKIKYNIMDYTPITYRDEVDYSGKVIGIKYEEYNVVGTYDNKEYFEANNSCFILNDNIKQIQSENIKYYGEEYFSPLIVLCNEYKDLDSVISNLSKDGFTCKKAGFINTDFTTLIVIFGFLIAIIFMLIALSTIWFSMKMDLQINKTEYGLLKCIGYKDKQLFYIMLTEQLFVSLFSLLVSSFISLYLINKIRIYVETCFDSIGSCKMILSLSAIIIGVLISIIIPIFIILFTSRKLHRISPIEASK